MTHVALLGAAGFVGSAIRQALEGSGGYRVTAVTRETYAQARSAGRYDIVINSATPSKRFWAKQHPELDFEETVKRTSEILLTWRADKFVQISSVSARCQLNTVYGRHKAAAEALCAGGANLIVRLGPLYGPGLSKGVVLDLANDRTVFLDGSSRYAFTPITWAAETIIANLGQWGILEVGARGSMALSALAVEIGSKSTFDGPVDHQEFESDWADAPGARAVVPVAAALRAHAIERL